MADGLGHNFIYGITQIGGNLYVATYGGLSVSSDGGDSFTNKNSAQGLASDVVRAVHANGSTLYVGTDAGLSVSTDGGSTFSSRTTVHGLGHNGVWGIHTSGNTLYVATQGGLAISSDGGNSFVNRTTANGLGNNYVNSLYELGSTLYAATNGGLSISTDGGSTFVNRTTANGLGDNIVYRIHIEGSIVYVATKGGVSISADGGNSFVNRTTADGLGSNLVNQIAASGNALYAATSKGLSTSTDGGVSFRNQAKTEGLAANFAIRVYATSTTLYVGTTGGLSMGLCVAVPPTPTPTPSPTATLQPVIAQLAPLSVLQNGNDFSLTVNGSGFGIGAVVQWNGSTLPTSFVSASQLTAQVPASRLINPGVMRISVQNPGGNPSAVAAFFVNENGAVTTDTNTGSSTSGESSIRVNVGGTSGTTATAQGMGTLVVAHYDTNPGGALGIAGGNRYLDVYVTAESLFTAIEIDVCGLPSVQEIDWWNGSQWLLASHQRYDAARGCVVVTVNGSTSPSLSQLTGTYFAALDKQALLETATPTLTPTATATAFAEATATPTQTATATATTPAEATATPTLTPTATATAFAEATATPTATATAFAETTATPTYTATATTTAPDTATATPTLTPTATATAEATATPTLTPTATATATAEATATPTLTPTATATPLDRDTDGVENSIEEGVPSPNGGKGDGNGDGIPDSQQPDVASLPNAVDGGYLTLVSSHGMPLRAVKASLPAARIPLDVALPQGLLTFQVSGLTPGSAWSATLIVHQGSWPDSYWKYGPTPDDPTDHWYEFTYDGETGARTEGNRVTLSFVDGKRGDSDLAANGSIADPGAPTRRTVHRRWLPLVTHQRQTAPDLVVEQVAVSPNSMQVLVKNVGGQTVAAGFWVDLYINPSIPPVAVNQVWSDLARQGAVWGVSQPLAPGQALLLSTGDSYFAADYSLLAATLSLGVPVWVQVDSWSGETNYGAVWEQHELAGQPYNNISQTTVQADARIDATVALPGAGATGAGLPPRPFP